MPIMFHNGKILFRGGKIAMTPGCCCGYGYGPNCCGYDCSNFPASLFFTIRNLSSCSCLADTYELPGECNEGESGPVLNWQGGFDGVCGLGLSITLLCLNGDFVGTFTTPPANPNVIQSVTIFFTVLSCNPLHLIATGTATILGTVGGCTDPIDFEVEVTE